MPVGKGFLVGAGPGDPDLLTLKAVHAIAAADVVVYDRLVPPEILACIRDGVAKIDVGKQARHHPTPQSKINELLVRLARTGRTVVRLKGGDPFIFGRGFEEALELRRNGIPFEVIPGVTAAQGCAASAGVPLTHRGLANGVRYLTGHCRSDAPLDFDWPGLADPDTTLVIYMGLANLDEIVGQLMAHGLAPDTPALAICQGTTPRERRLFAHLGALPAAVRAAAFEGPVLFIIGRVASLAEAWDADDAPLDRGFALEA
ncbi:MAG: uroporphyrinogen-III C-methyltransferase [Hyphomicrobiales bacterium]|nr:uroporphyrinogen-III C-methyltransferase [Hyphomicrobiales bacterium]